ncbi:MAG: ABC transporter permease [Egibacteraceae bacterium]
MAAIVVTALRRVVRDRIGLFFIVVLPFIVILLFGAGAGDGRDSSLPVGVVGDAFGGALVEALEAEPALAIRDFDDVDALTGAVRRRDVVGGVVVPGAAENADPGAAGTIQVRWVGDPASQDAPAARIAVESAIAELDARRVALRVAVDELGLSAAAARAAAAGLGEEPLLAVEQERTDEESLSFGVDESSQHNLVLFVFITSLTGGAALIESRRLGTAQRMLASPASAGTVLIGEAAARFAIALGQALIVLAGASLLFGADWGDPVAVAAVIVVFSLVGTGAAMLFGAVLDNTEQASAIAAPLGIGLGMLGGALWPLEIVPPVMQTIGRAVPHSWAIGALREVGTHGGGLTDVLGALGVLAGFAVVLLAVATWRLGISLRGG